MSIFFKLMGMKGQDNGATLLSSMEFMSKIENAKVQLVDVRTEMEFRAGHIKGAKNIDFYSGKFVEEFEKFDKSKPIFIYCRSGARSGQASRKLIKMGFIEVYDLKGGILSL